MRRFLSIGFGYDDLFMSIGWATVTSTLVVSVGKCVSNNYFYFIIAMLGKWHHQYCSWDSESKNKYIQWSSISNL